MKSDLAVITCHFNWCGFTRPAQNLNRFLRQMASFKIPVYGVELSLTGKFQTAGNPNWVQMGAREENICFQKEALLNIAVNLVPSQYTKIAWMDHDIYFENQNWYNETSEALETLNLVQPFEECIWTNALGECERTAKSVFAAPKPITEESLIAPFWSQKIPYHCGFAMAAKRSLWETGIKLYPYNFVGGGDNIVAEAAIIKELTPRALRLAYQKSEQKIESQFEPYIEWRQKYFDYVQELYGYIPGKVYHEYHGLRQNRKYGSREKIIQVYNVNIKNHVQLNYHGLLTLKTPPAGLLEALKQYFIERREDDISDIKIEGIDYNSTI